MKELKAVIFTRTMYVQSRSHRSHNNCDTLPVAARERVAPDPETSVASRF